VSQFDGYVQEQLSKNPDRLKEIRNEIISTTSDSLYRDLYRSIRSDMQDQMNNVLNAISGCGVRIQGSNHTISQEEYEELLERDRQLTVLENWGVDNWDGYDIAMSSMDEEE
jgi:hypothetical protein